MCAYRDERTLDQQIAALAHRNHGIVDVDELCATGATRRQIGHRVATERLIPLYREASLFTAMSRAGGVARWREIVGV